MFLPNRLIHPLGRKENKNTGRLTTTPSLFLPWRFTQAINFRQPLPLASQWYKRNTGDVQITAIIVLIKVKQVLQALAAEEIHFKGTDELNIIKVNKGERIKNL